MITSSVLISPENNAILLWHGSCYNLYMNTKILKKYFNEMYADDGAVREIYERYRHWLKELPEGTVLSQIFIKCKAALICGHSYPAKAINCL